MSRMRKGVAFRVVLALALLVAPVTPLALHGSPDTDESLRDPVEQLRTGVQELRASEPEPEPVSAEVLVTVKLRANASLPDRALEVRRTYSRRGATHVEGYVPLTAVRDLSTRPAVESVRMESAADPGRHVAAGVAAIGADDLHERGWTGRNVTVGVIDNEFRVSDPELAGHVAAYRSFGATGDAAHGTAVASVVTDTAPNADLHLAAVGPTTSEAEYREAVGWLRASGADVIVDAGSYFGRHGTGTDPLSRVAANASGDAVFVTSAGNYGQRHWQGVHRSDDGDWVTFAPGSEGNLLAGGEVIRGRVRASLTWNRSTTPAGNATVENATAAMRTANGTNATRQRNATNTTATAGRAASGADYDLYLFRRGVRGPQVVAKATADNGSAAYIDATVPRGRYYLAVRAANVTRPHRLELFASRDLRHRVADGSVTAPATAPGVLAVGAYERSTGRVAAFSSRGPVGNRTGVDLVAPDAVMAPGTGAEAGTSFAAPYAAGAAALLRSRYPDLSAHETRALLVASATDVGPAGPDVAAGHGLLDAAAAGELATDRARYAAVNSTTDRGVAALGTGRNPFDPPPLPVVLAAETEFTVTGNATRAGESTGPVAGTVPGG